MKRNYTGIIITILLSFYCNLWISQTPTLWGVTANGGNGIGTLFSIPTGSTAFSSQYNFLGSIGSSPQYLKLVQAPSGKMYGTTNLGGSANLGVLFEYDPLTNTYSLLANFTGTATGSRPFSSVMLAANGNLYGMTQLGGTNNEGVIFEYNISTGVLTKKHDFLPGTGTGRQPAGSLIEGAAGKLYGVTRLGGTSNVGVLFEYNYGTSTYTVLNNFSAATGSSPFSAPIIASNGKLYGTTQSGGAGFGVIYEYDLSTNTFTKQVDFTGTVGLAIGAAPIGSMIQAANGKLYGNTFTGGIGNVGVIYEYDYTTNTYTKLYDFVTASGSGSQSSLIQATNGMLYGLTRNGGLNNVGVLYEFDITGSLYTKKFDFSTTDGTLPVSSLFQASGGLIYGVTPTGGSLNTGTLFEYSIGTNTFSKKLNLNYTDAGQTLGSLVHASNDKMYGLASVGGTNNLGSVYEYNIATNTFSKTIDLSTTLGSQPNGSMIESTPGKLYGMTRLGGAFNLGVIFEYNFSTNTYTKKIDLTAANGSSPYGSMVKASNGKLYGVTNLGGANSSGALFEYDDIANTYTKRHDFIAASGSNPFGSLIQANNGKLYGMTRNGGLNGVGTIFEFVTSTNTYSKVADMSTANGSLPLGSLVQDTNGKLYGLTEQGGLNSVGVLFEFDPSTNSYTKLIDLNATTGQNPQGTLRRAANGKLYGLTKTGGTNNLGTLIEYDISTNSLVKKMDLSMASGNTPNYTQLVEVCPVPVAPGSISSFTSLCFGASGNQTFSVAAVANATSYTWSFPAGASIISGSNTNVNGVDFSSVIAGTYTIEVAGVNICGNGPSSAVSVTVLPMPSINLSGGVICNGQSFTLSPSGASTYTFSSGSAIVSPSVNTSYTVTGTGADGCVSSTGAVAEVTVNSIPPIGVNSGTLCSGSSFTMVPSGALTYTYSSGTSVVSPTATTNYTVTGTSADGCINSVGAVAGVTVYALPLIGVNSGTICNGSSFTMVPSGAFTYTFSSGTNIVSPTTTTFYTLSGTSVEGCVSAAPAISDVTVHALPVIGVNSGTICFGNSFTMIPSGASTYTFSSGTSIVSPSSSTAYTVIGTSSLGCVSSGFATSNVTVIALPTISVNSGPICLGEVFTMLPSGALTYTYSSGTNTVAPTTTTNYFVTGTSSLGCVSGAPAIASVTVNPLPLISVNSGTICLGNSFTITPNGANTYTYSGGTNVVSPATTTSYSVTGTTSLGCVSPTVAISNVTVIALPSLTVNSGTICSGKSFTIVPSGALTYTFSSGTNIVSPTTNTFYTVVGTSSVGCVSSNTAVSNVTVYALPFIGVNSGTICSGKNFTMNPFGALTYTYSSGVNVVSPLTNTFYTVVGTNSLGCVSSNTAISNVTVIALPIISVNSGSICSGKVFTMTPTGAATYTFYNGSSTVSPVVNTSYSVTGTSSVGCVSSTPAVSNVTVVPLPNVLISGTNAICFGSSVSLVASGAQTYSWSTGSTNATITVTPSTATTYSVLGVDNTGCSKMTALAIGVVPLPTITAASGAVCPGNSFIISPSGALSYTYSSGSATVFPAATSNYSVIGSDANGCVSANAAVVTVSVVNTLTVTVSGNNTICFGDTANLIANGASSYSWSQGSVTNTVALTPTTSNTYTVIGSSGSCHDTTQITVTVNQLPVMLVNSSPSVICINESAEITVTGAANYSWSTQQIGNTIVVSPTLSTVYTVYGTDANGCSSSTTYTQNVDECIGLPALSAKQEGWGVYPNPNNGNFYIELHQASKVCVMNILGQKVVEFNLDAGKHPVNLHDNAKGIYFIQLEQGTKTRIVKVIKE